MLNDKKLLLNEILRKCLFNNVACERGAWECVQFLISERADEINQCYDEYYPIHQVKKVF